MKTFTLYTVVALLMIIGCSQNIMKGETPPAVHVQKSTELQTIMHKFDNLIYQHYQSELDRDRKRIDYTKEMIVVVDDLVINSQALQSLPNQNFTAEESKGFLTLAKKLERKSEALKEIVLSYQTEKIAPTLDEINAICKQCHANLR